VVHECKRCTDPNRSIYSPYQSLVENKILYFLNFFTFFLDKGKLFVRILDRPLVMIFFLAEKIKFDFLQEFDMENKLNGSDWSFLT
jgi:hypothetical protein